MTETTKTVLQSYQVRKTKKQKAAFAAYVREIAEQNGYLYTEEKGMFGAKNLIVGDALSAKVLYTAHYDTCARLPFPNFITPKNFLIYLLYQLLITALLLLPSALVMTLLPAVLCLVGIPAEVALPASMLLAYLALLFMLCLLMAGPANKQTANDNTSGVTVLLDTLQAMPPELRTKCAFVFFDLEEAGLFGSASYRSAHKGQTNGQLVVNFDCVSDGDRLLFVLRKGARAHADALAAAFPQTEALQCEIAHRGVFYPSDQANFPQGVGVAALKYSKRFRVLYMDRIHTKRDTVYQEENIAYLTDGCIRLTAHLASHQN